MYVTSNRYRSETSSGVCELLKGLPLEEIIKFITFLSKLSRTAKVLPVICRLPLSRSNPSNQANQRYLAVEVSVKLLQHLHELKELSGQGSPPTHPLYQS